VSCFRIRPSKDARLFNMYLSDGNLVRRQIVLVRRFFEINSQVWIGIGKEVLASKRCFIS